MSRRGTNVYKRKDGRWEARYVERIDTDGTKKLKSVYGKTYKETVEKRIQKIKELGSTKTQKQMPLFCDIAEHWFDEKQKELKPSSQERYRHILNHHILPVLGELHCNEITTERMNYYIFKKLRNITTEDVLSPRTIHNIFGIINEIICYARDYLNCNINITAITLPKLNVSRRNVFSYEAIRILSNAAKENYTEDLRCLGILICMYTGLRIGELCALKWSDINLDVGNIYVTRTIQRLNRPNASANEKKTYLHEGPVKTHKSKRDIPICSILMNILKEQSKSYSKNAYVLSGLENKCVEPRNFQYFFKYFQESQSLEPLNPHALRHTFASMGISMGMDAKTVSELLGHSNVNITLNCYVHISIEEKRKQIELMSYL